jgi:hypothetical protein
LADPPIDFIGRQLNAPRGPKAKPSNFSEVLESDEKIISRYRPRFLPYVAAGARWLIAIAAGLAIALFVPGVCSSTGGSVLAALGAFRLLTHLWTFRGTEYALTELRLLVRARDPQFAWHYMVEVVRLRRLVSVDAGRTTVTIRHKDVDGDVHTLVLVGVADPKDLARRLKAPSSLPLTDGSYRDG